MKKLIVWIVLIVTATFGVAVARPTGDQMAVNQDRQHYQQAA